MHQHHTCAALPVAFKAIKYTLQCNKQYRLASLLTLSAANSTYTDVLRQLLIIIVNLLQYYWDKC